MSHSVTNSDSVRTLLLPEVFQHCSLRVEDSFMTYTSLQNLVVSPAAFLADYGRLGVLCARL